MVSLRPNMKADVREKYKRWSRKFRLKRSDKTLKLRPQTYRRLFKRETRIE